MTVRPLTPADNDAWHELRQALFPHEPADALRSDPYDYQGNTDIAFVWEQPDSTLGGFAEASIRKYADGCETSPVGFLEAWYVAPEVRRRGVGTELVDAVEKWVASKGCTEVGSDTAITNTVSRTAHGACGFQEVEEAVHFSKLLSNDTVTPEGPDRSAVVSLREITGDNVLDICDLAVGIHQSALVAPNAESLAQSAVSERAWTRAVYADETPVGFIMMGIDPTIPKFYLWRFMIDKWHQGKGFGKAAMALLDEEIRSRPDGHEIVLHVSPANGGAMPFYASLGYVPTGEVAGDEAGMKKVL